MSKVVVLLYVLIAASLLLFLSSPPQFSPRPRKVRRLHTSFDPMFGELEWRRNANGVEFRDVKAFKEKLESEGNVLARYFGEDGALNTTQRLTYLFPMLDQSPKDGFISFDELDVWNKRQAMDRLMHITAQRLKDYDKDKDGTITLLDFLSDVPEEERDWNNKEHGKPGWWKDLFESADMDGNGSLNVTEFNDFLHPEDSSNPKVQAWFLKEKLREMDENQDGKLSFEEFRSKTYALFSHLSEFETVKNVNPKKTKAQQTFEELDVNKDGFLTAEELKPIVHQIHPGEFEHATLYTKQLMHRADDNKDGKLTLEEMLNHQYEFYNAVFEEETDDYDDDYDDGHDEL